jgi:hypothetical protein
MSGSCKHGNGISCSPVSGFSIPSLRCMFFILLHPKIQWEVNDCLLKIFWTAFLIKLRAMLTCTEESVNKSTAVSLNLFYCLLYSHWELGSRSRYSDWLRAGRPRGRSLSPCRVKYFLHVVQSGSGVHPTSYPMGTGGSFLGGKAVEAWSWPLTSN